MSALGQKQIEAFRHPLNYLLCDGQGVVERALSSVRRGPLSRLPMSALGQKQTFAMQQGMSALPPKADMCSATRHVRFVPIADIDPRLLDHLVGMHQDCFRNCDADCLRSFGVDH